MRETQHPPAATPVGGQDYLAVQASPEFQEMRNRLRRFLFPMSGLFLICIALIGAFYLFTLPLGYGAAALGVPPRRWGSRRSSGWWQA